uniref:G-protein coupled receptors family 1 profile domain-containing protein n=1 Tax=Romanomermis culicivorax TaxID=13658 RepID=A0A915L5B8_ROMCU
MAVLMVNPTGPKTSAMPDISPTASIPSTLADANSIARMEESPITFTLASRFPALKSLICCNRSLFRDFSRVLYCQLRGSRLYAIAISEEHIESISIVVPTYCVYHCELFSTYVIIVASWERYYAVVEATSYSRSQESNTSTIQDKVDIYNCCLVKNSKSKIYCKLIAVLVIVTLLRLPCFFEYEHEIRPQCIEIDFLASVDFKPLIINNDFYKTVYNFYFMNTVQVFAPMCMLSILNSMIVYKLQRQKNLAKKLVALFMETRIRKTILQKIKDTSEIRIAAYRMAAIVLTYIICNSLHLFLSIMEYACKQVLLEDENGAPTPMYNYLVDVVSLLFMFNSFLRLFIHLAINGTLRRDFKVMMFSILNIKYNFEALPSSEI